MGFQINKTISGNSAELQQQSDDYNIHVDTDHDSSLVTSENPRQKLSPSGVLRELNQAELEWLLVAIALDRLSIAAYLLAFAIMMMSYA